jgi:hypothetical protein
MNTETNNTPLIIFIISLVIALFLYIKYIHYKKRCRFCGKWNALKIINKKVVSRDDISIKKRLVDNTRDGQGKIIKTKTREVYIPGIKEKILVNTQCKYCKNEDSYYITRSHEK